MCLLFSCGTHEYNPHWLGELGDLGTCPLDDSLKSLGVICVVQTLCSSGKSWELGGPSCKALCWSGVYGESVSSISTCFNVGIFSVSVCRSHSNLTSRFLCVGHHVYLCILWIHGKREVQGSPMLPTWWYHSPLPLLLNTFGKLEYCFLYLSRFSRKIWKEKEGNPHPTRIPKAIISPPNFSLTVYTVIIVHNSPLHYQDMFMEILYLPSWPWPQVSLHSAYLTTFPPNSKLKCSKI